MSTNYVQAGATMEWANGTGSDVSKDDVVVIGNTIAIAAVDIADGESGTLNTEGVFTVPKVSAAVFTQGDALIYDVSASEFDDPEATPATGDISGAVIAWADGANGETTCEVKIGYPGTVSS